MSQSIASQILGITYTICWGAANWPQIYNFYKNQSVAGYSLDFYIWNQTGFIYYMIYTTCGYYAQGELGLQRTIVFQDIAFATAALIACTILGIQIYLYRNTIVTTVNPAHAFGVTVMWIIAIYNLLLGFGGTLPWFSKETHLYAYSVLQYLGLSKSFVSFIKYVPQAILNFKKKSTYGWAIQNVFLDATGGILALSQMIINAYDHRDPVTGNWDMTHVTGNVPKLILATESLMFDFIFLTQHFILYRANNKAIEAAEKVKNEAVDAPLLAGQEDDTSSMQIVINSNDFITDENTDISATRNVNE